MDARIGVIDTPNGVATPFVGHRRPQTADKTLPAPRLLSINKFFYRRGGAETVFLEHNRMFEDLGWQVIPFAMRHPRNLPSPWSRFFAAPVEFDAAQPLGRRLAAAGTLLYSFESRRRIRQLCSSARPTIAHAHNIYHQLSPSILSELRQQGVPVVMTLHDLKIACPAYKMFANGSVCERCRGRAFRHVVQQRCIRGSFAMSALIWLESSLHGLLKAYAGNVTRFVVPSRFYMAKLSEWGLNPSRLTYIPNFVQLEPEPTVGRGDQFVYVGRLSQEKGVATLIRAAVRARVPLLIVGTGPEEQPLHRLVADAGAEWIRFSGHLEGATLRNAIAGARAVVLPSEWYENAPVALLEAGAMGVPVIGARIGGIPELIHEEVTGYLFESGNIESLTEVLVRVRSTPERTLDEMGRHARQWVQTEFSPSRYRERMQALYHSVGADI